MTIDYDLIQLKFIDIAKTVVGSQLSQMGPDNDIPAVIPMRPSHDGNKLPPRPDYPYIAVDITDVTENGSAWQYWEYINDDDLTVHESIKTISISYRCYGDGNLPKYIINDLRASFDFQSVRDDLRSTIEAGIVLTGDIDSTPIQLATKWLESSAFNILISVVDSQVDPNSEIIETVELDGELHDSPDDNEPLVIEISIDSNNP